MSSQRIKNSMKAIKTNEENKLLSKLEAGISVKIGNQDINKLYNDKLNEKMDLKETVSKVLKKPAPPKVKKVKEISEKGKSGIIKLSKYREQVKEALELKKNIDNKNLLNYSSDEDEEEEEIQPIIQPSIDLKPIYGEIEALKKKNQYLEERYLIRNTIQDISNMRRNMSIKF